MKATLRFCAALILLLNSSGKAPAATPSETARKTYQGFTPLEWSVALADSEIARTGDGRAWREGRRSDAR